MFTAAGYRGLVYSLVRGQIPRLCAVALLVGVAFFGAPAVTQAQVVISGSVYSDNGVTGMAAAKNVRVAIGTTTVSIYNASSSAGTGAWTITVPAGNTIASGTRIAAWIEGDPLTRGAVLTKASSTANISGLHLYQKRVIARHEATTATTTTIADFAFYTFVQDAGLPYVIGSSSDLRIFPGNELYLWSGMTFAPGGPVVVLGNASTTPTDGSFYMATNSVYIASSTLTLAGSFAAASTASVTGVVAPIMFNATTTGKSITAPLGNTGHITFSSASGAWAFIAAATTTDFKILAGTVTAPATTLVVTGDYINYASFLHNSGTLTMSGPVSTTTADISMYAVGRDMTGSAAGTGNLAVNTFAATGTYLYTANAASAVACSQTAGSATGCELQVYNISSSTNPVYVAGRDAGGNNASTSALAITSLAISGQYLFVGKGGSAIACTQVAGTADGCEIMVFDISSSTNPVYVAGRDAGANAAGVQSQTISQLVIASSTLYVVKAGSATACSQTAGSAVGCELIAFDIASNTNPVYVAGRDVNGDSTGTGNLTMNSIGIASSTLYVLKAGNATACAQTTGTGAGGCELMVFDISSSTNPVYRAGRDVTGNSTGVGNSALTFLSILGTSIFVGKVGDTTACSQTAGSAIGCELQVYDIASSTNPVYAAGRDAGGNATGVQTLGINQVLATGSVLYVTKAASAIACEQKIGYGVGCELMVFDISSSSVPTYIAGRDAGGDTDGVQTLGATALALSNSTLYVSKAASATACSQVPGSAVGCEIMGFSVGNTARGLMMGTMNGASVLNHVVASGTVVFLDNATTTNLTIRVNATTTAPDILLVQGNYSNQGYFSANEGMVIVASSAAQTMSGVMTGQSSFYQVRFQGVGAKTILNNASTTRTIIDSGATVIAPSILAVADSYLNNGTFTAGSGTVQTTGYLGELTAGMSGGSGTSTDIQSITHNALLAKGNFMYVAKTGNGTACAQTAGASQGCELFVYDVSSSTSPAFRAGRDITGDATGVGNLAMNAMALSSSSNTLYVAKAGNATACSQTAGSATGCELMVFDISSSTNPVYVAGRDAGGNNASTSAITISQIKVVGNFLYVVKSASALACTQIAGTADGCELMVFDIASSTNPVYVAGRDAGGDSAGVQSLAMQDLVLASSTLYVVKAGSATACSQTAGSAVGCELMVFNIASSTNPVYVAGRDIKGDAVGVGNVAIQSVVVSDTALYVAKAGNATACSQTAGSADGCELMVFDIASSTNPVYVAGRDVSGNNAGIGSVTTNAFGISGRQLYVAKAGNATACSQTAGSADGCELMVFDIASSTNPVYVAGRDSTGLVAGRDITTVQTLLATGTVLYTGKAGDAAGCEPIVGFARGCELMMYQLPTMLAGTLVGASTLSGVSTFGQVVFSSILASTTNITINPGATLAAPTSSLTVSGNFTNNGTFTHGNGQVQLTGTNQTISGAAATTTFYDLIQLATTTAATTFGTTSTIVVLRNLTLQGTSSAVLTLSSVSPTASWRMDPWSSSSVSVAYLDVRDSNNISATTTNIMCINGCVDRGNNLNWIFGSSSVGSSTIAEHTAGQVANAFTAHSKTDATLFAFRLIPSGSMATVTDAVLNIDGVVNLNVNNFSNLRLYRDGNGNADYDVSDVAVGGSGLFTVVGQTGSITFTGDFRATSSMNYILVGDWTAPANGSFMNVSLVTGGLTIIDAAGTQTVFGSVSSIQHSRNNQGSGGGGSNGRSAVGGDAPVGDGGRGGGTSEAGELMGDDPDYFWPSSNSGGWNNGANAYDRVDGTYATTSSGVNHSYQNAGFAIPVTNIINGIEIKLELSGTTVAGTVDVQLSWDGGGSWTSIQTTPTLTTADSVRTLGGPADMWGRAWTAAELSNSNFAIRVAGNPSSNTVRLDAIQVRVYHQAGGGGQGGGGGGGI